MRCWSAIGALTPVFLSVPVLPTFAAEPYIPAIVTLRAPGGHFDNWQKDVPCAAGSLSGSLKIEDPDFNSKWETAAQVVLRTASGRAAVYQIQTVQHSSPLQENLVVRAHAQQESRHVSIPKQLDFGAPQQFAISWTSSGDVTVSIGLGVERTVQLAEPISSLELVVSGGATEFSSLSVTCGPAAA